MGTDQPTSRQRAGVPAAQRSAPRAEPGRCPPGRPPGSRTGSPSWPRVSPLALACPAGRTVTVRRRLPSAWGRGVRAERSSVTGDDEGGHLEHALALLPELLPV